MNPTHIYLIGAGVIARYHAAAIAKLPDPDGVTLSVADPNPTALAEFCAQFPQALAFASADEMLAQPAQPNDIVIVATPPFMHLELTRLALSSGRHTLCEKPLALSRAEAGMMLDLARANRRLLGCCSSRFLGLPTAAEVKRLVRSGALGRIYHATLIDRAARSRSGIEYQPSSRWFLDKRKNGGGIIMDWGPYDFSGLNEVLEPVRVDVLGAWAATPVTDIDPTDTPYNVEAHGGATLRFTRDDGSTCHVTYERASCTHGAERFVIEIEGTRGAVTWDWLMPGATGDVRYSFDEGGQLKTRVTTFAADRHLGPHDKPLVYFHRRVTGEPSPAVIDEQAVFNFSCFRAVLDSADTGQPQTIQALPVRPLQAV